MAWVQGGNAFAMNGALCRCRSLSLSCFASLTAGALALVPEGNAPHLAETPNHGPLAGRQAQPRPSPPIGPDVGLPRGQMGNSEVGHTNIGAGRVVAMDLGQIDLAIEEGSFAKTWPTDARLYRER